MKPLALVVLASLLAASSNAATLALDPFDTELPPNDCLTNSHQPVVYYGSFCDAVACPPGNIVGTCPGGELGATYPLANDLPVRSEGLFRILKVDDTNGFGAAWARIDPATHRAEVSGTDGNAFNMNFQYFLAAGDEWDLAASLANGFAFDLQGDDVTPSHPLWFQLELLGPGNSNAFAVKHLEVTSPGPVRMSFADLFTFGGFSYSHVRAITLVVSDCTFGCASPGGPPRHYSLGPLQITTELPTAAATGTWGRLKRRFR